MLFIVHKNFDKIKLIFPALPFYRRLESDIENVMSVGSSAHVKFLSVSKILALYIHYFVENALTVMILLCFM